LAGDKTYETLSFSYDEQCRHMKISSNGKFVVFVVSNRTGADDLEQLQLKVLTVDSYDLFHISGVNIDGAEIKIYDAAISNDGRLVGLVGSEKNIGWIAVIDVEGKEIIWQQDINETEELTKIIFSPVNDTVYAAGIGRIIYSFKVDDENLVSRFQMDEDIVAQKRQYLSAMAVSNNGYFLGASTEPVGTIYIWNLVTDKRVYTGNSRMIITSGLAFSPDSTLFAVSDIQNNPVKIFKVPY